MMKLRLRCYCCGERITSKDDFMLLAPGHEPVDRVFVMLAKHGLMAEDFNARLIVSEGNG